MTTTFGQFRHPLPQLTCNLPPFPNWIKGGKCLFKKGSRHFRHEFEVFDLLYVTRGCLYMNEAGTKYAIEEGHYLMLAPNFEHFGHAPCQNDTEFYWLHFEFPSGYTLQESSITRWSDILLEDSNYTQPAIYQFQIPRFAAIRQREYLESTLYRLIEMNDLHTPEQALHQQLLFGEFFLQLQKEAMDIPTTSEKVAEKIIAYIHTHFREPIKMGDLARELLLHPDYIGRCMQQALGKSPIQYLNQYRLSRAKTMLTSTNLTIADIAREVGIGDSTYFSKLYRKYEGITPLEFRRTGLKS